MKILPLTLLVTLLLGCHYLAASKTSSASSASSALLTPESSSNCVFTAAPIPDAVFKRMQGRSFPANCTVKREDLRYLTVWHLGFDGKIHKGEMVVGKDVAEDVLDIFRELLQKGYKIERVALIDDYDANDEKSMMANNSSAFCFRLMTGGKKLSKHSLGVAIDINPLYNPYVKKKADGKLHVEPMGGTNYVDRSRKDWRYVRKDDDCYKAFARRGFQWGGEWTSLKDYQHFEK